MNTTNQRITEERISSETNRLAFLATTAIERAMKHFGLKRKDLAERLDTPRSRITKVLDGETNMTLRTLASFGLACGVRWHFTGVDAAAGTMLITWPDISMGGCFPVQCADHSVAVGYKQAEIEAAEHARVCSVRTCGDPVGPL